MVKKAIAVAIVGAFVIGGGGIAVVTMWQDAGIAVFVGLAVFCLAMWAVLWAFSVLEAWSHERKRKHGGSGSV